MHGTVLSIRHGTLSQAWGGFNNMAARDLWKDLQGSSTSRYICNPEGLPCCCTFVLSTIINAHFKDIPCDMNNKHQEIMERTINALEGERDAV
jgi:hypothetical protein